MTCYFRAIAVDYDGTLTVAARPTETVLAAIREQRNRGVRVVLMTGRILSELRADFPAAELEFDAIVGENGAVLWTPLAGERLLAAPVAADLDRGLRAAGVPCRRGAVILATDARFDQLVLEQIAQQHLEYQLSYNRAALMILPAGISKGTGLFEALGELAISHHSTVGIGDAENDHSLLEFCELGVAVANAVPSLQERADIVLRESNGEGVAAFLGGPILRGELRVRPRRWHIEVGVDPGGQPVMLPASQTNMLVVGGSGTGKSFLAGLLVELLTASGYSVCVLDPEGDHVTLGELRGVMVVGGAEGMPGPDRLATLLRHRFGSVVVDMSRLSGEEKRRHGRIFLTALQHLRRESGLPHWTLVDEAPQVLSREALAGACGTASQGWCLVTHRPQDLPPATLDQMDLVLVVRGGEPLVAPLLGPRFGAPLGPAESPLIHGEALWLERGHRVRFRIGTRQRPHLRHWHKYLSSQLPPGKRFYFRTAHGPTGAAAGNLVEFHHEIERADAAVLEHHLAGGDFARWLGSAIRDPVMAEAIRAVEEEVHRRRIIPELARQRILTAIEERYATESPGELEPDAERVSHT
jgi:hydroxymethylpyrimidine pyrophosphatase-like HAD family hydrolase